MSMSTHIYGLMDDEVHSKHVRIWKMCKEEQVSLPKETAAYFGDNSCVDPDAFIEEDIEDRLIVSLDKCAVPYLKESREGYDVYVENLPPEVKIIRFFNSY